MPNSSSAQPSSRPAPGRHLKPPNMHYIPNMSLPRLLAQYVTQRDKPLDDEHRVHTIVPAPPSHTRAAFSLGKKSLITDSHMAITTGSCWTGGGGALSAMKRALHREAGPRFQTGGSAASSARVVHRFSTDDDEVEEPMKALPTTLMTYFQQQTIGFDVDDAVSEYERKQQVHPRLRWPRLISRGSDTSGDLDGVSPPRTPGKKSPWDIMRAHSISKMDVDDDDDDKSVGSRPKSVASSASSTLILGVGKNTKSIKAPRSRGPQSRPAVLPRCTEHHESPAGVVSTLHVPRDPRERALERERERDHVMSTTSLVSLASSRASTANSRLSRVSTVNSRVSTANSQASKAPELDRKWFMRVAPISCLPSEPVCKAARHAATAAAKDGRDHGFDIGGLGGEYLNFENWGLCGDYLESLLGAHCDSNENNLRGLRYLNLSDNRLQEDGIRKLMGYGLPEGLISLSLASNGFGEKGGKAVIEFVGRCLRLKQLDLSRNSVGDAVVEELCNVLDHQCPELEGLGLGGSNIGVSPKGGAALGVFVGKHEKLKSLDLSWNALHGPGAHSLLKGLYSNGLPGAGNLRRLNIAWNRLGSGRHVDQMRRSDAERSAKLLSSVFQDGQTLFHLDISYNGFTAEDCALMASGLHNNHTLFGIHLLGNEAALDDLGFVVPMKRQAAAERTSLNEGDAVHQTPKISILEMDDADEVDDIQLEDFNSHEVHQRFMNHFCRSVPSGMKLDRPRVCRTGDLGKLHPNPSLQSMVPDSVQSFSEEDLNVERQWAADNTRIQTTADWIKQDYDSLARNTSCCWICENWVEHHVTYIPGFSGSEDAPEVVWSVSALFSIDGYLRPTNLRIKEESRRKSHSRLVLTHMYSRKSVTSTPSEVSAAKPFNSESLMLNSHGRVTKWVGVRMLPPTTAPIKVVFLVNDVVTVANDMPREKLSVPKLVALHAKAGEPARTITINEVNVMSAGDTAWENFRRGRHHAVCVLEDPTNRNEFTVMPRRLAHVEEKAKPIHESWTFEASTFKEYMRDSLERNEQCFDKDWSLCRLTQILKSQETRKMIMDFIRPKYISLMLAYWTWAFGSCHDSSHPVGVSFNVFREHLVSVGGVGSGKLIDGNYCKLSDPDCVFVAANVIDYGKRSQFKIIPEKDLSRFQFLEAIVRVALRRFLVRSVSCSTAEECSGAVTAFYGLMSLGDDIVNMRQTFQEALFTEECCLTYQEHIDTLKGIYDGYRVLFGYPGRAGKYVSFSAWVELMNDACVFSESFGHHKVGMAFALAKEIRVDITSDWRHMELSWGEFLVAIGAIVRLQDDWDKEFFADLLEMFITDHLDEAYSKLLHKGGSSAPRRRAALTFNTIDPTMQPLTKFLAQVFEDADDDKSGSVDIREFRRALHPPSVREEFNRLGLHISEIDVLFRIMDSDGSGDITMEELITGFVKMKNATAGIEKAISYVRKAFAEADKDCSGTLDYEEFQELFEHPSFLKKLHALGVSTDDVDELFNIMDKEGTGDVTVEDVIQGFVTLRDPRTRGLRGVKHLRELFEKADADGSGFLDLKEVEDTFATEEVEEKFQRMMLQVPNWTTLFEELDIDGSGDLSWEEISDGMAAFWARACL